MSAAYSTPEASNAGMDRNALAVGSATLFARATGESVTLLRNSGGKPVRVHGDLIAEGSSRTVASTSWHEVAFYRMAGGATAVAIRFMRGGSACAVHRARLCTTNDEAATWLEEFDPSCDISADFDVSDRRMSAASVALKAASLRDRTERLDREYRALVSEVLFRLETEAGFPNAHHAG